MALLQVKASAVTSVFCRFLPDSSNLSTEQDSNQASLTMEVGIVKIRGYSALNRCKYTFGESFDSSAYGTTRGYCTGTIAFEIGYRHQPRGGTILGRFCLATRHLSLVRLGRISCSMLIEMKRM
ncbi:hypothetical protein O9993_03785 [Vibrio lentus]|nr:hypothetical protein [Vibrio lentus]